jgi:hypothetical protein
MSTRERALLEQVPHRIHGVLHVALLNQTEGVIGTIDGVDAAFLLEREAK